jgi:murein DD-endopeptidase MepM/ murein hydrolase activator NlpD
MKFGAPTAAGNAPPSADGPGLAWLTLLALTISCPSGAQALYKYRGEDGEWKFTDRPPPDDGQVAEVRELPQGQNGPEVEVRYEIVDGMVVLTANNHLYAPVELVVLLDEAHYAALPDDEQRRTSVLAPRSIAELMRVPQMSGAAGSVVEFRYQWFPGDPAATHRPDRAYRAPFAVARQHRISQAFPELVTHVTRDSVYAVDISMPIGTDIYAARGGTVVEVASSNYRGGLDTSRPGAEANLVRILHDDGTFAIYAHLNWNSIRVRPGDEVVRGEYIADSGNTGFSSGPHLHFVVVRNAGMSMEAVPIVFEGRNSSSIAPQRGLELTAY